MNNLWLSVLQTVVVVRQAIFFLGKHIVSLHVKVSASVFGTQKNNDNHVGKNSANKNTHHFGVVKARLSVWKRDGKSFTNGGFNGRRCRRRQVTQSVRKSNNQGSVCWRRQLGQVDRNNTPGALDTCLQKESAGVDAWALCVCPWVNHGASKKTGQDNGQSSAHKSGKVAAHHSAENGAQVGHGIGHGRAVSSILQLRAQKRRVQILRAVGHEVETGHHEHTVDHHKPVSADGLFGVFGEAESGLFCLAVLFHLGLSRNKRICLGIHHSPDNEKHWRPRSKPENGSPAMQRVVCDGSVENNNQKIPKGVTFSENARQNASTCGWRIVHGRGQRKTKHTAHGDSKERPHAQKSLVGLDKTRSDSQHNQKRQVDDVGPFSAVAVTPVAENNGAHRTQHKHQGDAPRDVLHRLVERLGHGLCVQGNSEKVKGVPGPAHETHEKIVPVFQGHLVEIGKRVEDLLLRVSSQLLLGHEKRQDSRGKVLFDGPRGKLGRFHHMLVVLLHILGVNRGNDRMHVFGYSSVSDLSTETKSGPYLYPEQICLVVKVSMWYARHTYPATHGRVYAAASSYRRCSACPEKMPSKKIDTLIVWQGRIWQYCGDILCGVLFLSMVDVQMS
ncbi:hypothetical protein CLUG_05467 [Clavispora lusitaniae ATCC 42720]|uniref:Uncharacterized protein n=1 Tax=Clavispora lusitaniae (strain ATCC 42720) TaxID=306902 RepID=C4YB02_CLAL4|nr:uncharacterized protein CLUG_05467 [Clavispora lusitaniae ATCC 42720]EEQ41340.1 hypothetical protein CLUG_05467 [Clavispora lusitaniae ATCC 42720]